MTDLEPTSLIDDERHSHRWRKTSQIAAQWADADAIDPQLFRFATRGPFFELLDELDVTLLVTREYEHFVLALTSHAGKPEQSHLPLPHPSGIAVDHARQLVHVASTRNPNQIFTLAPVTGALGGRDFPEAALAGRPLLPVSSRMLPGALYLHDLALIDCTLYANAVGENAVVRVLDDGTFEEVWWPRSIETAGLPLFSRNVLQLNSIAAGTHITNSLFTASSSVIGSRVPGQRNFPVDRRGVLFDGATREPVVTGLTRPHSARYRGSDVYVDNSGYGEVVLADPSAGSYEVLSRLPGWTRGLAFARDVAFVGTSKVIERFAAYAPGLKGTTCVCGVHALAIDTGLPIASITWPAGDQIFGIECMARSMSNGFVFSTRKEHSVHEKVFAAFSRRAVP
jgi:uncharacterized protein (TIGR03032 family)